MTVPRVDPRAPRYRQSMFECPHCSAYAQQVWGPLSPPEEGVWMVQLREMLGGLPGRDSFEGSTCAACRRTSVWHLVTTGGGQGRLGGMTGLLVWPAGAAVAEPLAPETPQVVAELWDEARSIAHQSSRGAAALLRLALQVLLREHVVPGEEHLSTAIGKAFAGGVPEMVQQSMDYLRITGNDAVHASEVRLDDDPEQLPALFALLRYVVEETIVRPAQIRGLYDSLPESQRAAIEQRNERARGT